ncbi:MAG TPA: hypothetical protein VG755_05670 [Nannocystaceae bacterium]|nr:hypothetical protein [Nannocystaceae bacterium]
MLCGVAIASITSIAHAQDPAPVVHGPTSVTSTPSGPAATPPVAEAPVATPPVAEAPVATPPSAELPAGTTSLTPTPPVAAPTPMEDPFRPGQPQLGWDDPSTVDTVPRTTTTTTTTVVVTQRVPVAPAPPPPPPPPAARRTPFFIGGYGGIGFAFGAVSKRMASFSNLRGGILLGERIAIGASFTRMTKRFGPPIEGLSGQSYQLAMAYGGVDLGLAIIRRGPFELGVATLLGAGSACVQTYHRRNQHCVETVKMMVAEPSVFAHFNLTNWMRLGMQGGYRFVGREAWKRPNDFRVAGGFFGANVEFGWFKRPDTGTRRRARWG